MERLSRRQTAVLEILDAQIEELEEKLRKAQPLINELNRLKQTRRVLLSEGGTTGGGGRSNAILSQEQVIHFLTENGPSKPQAIAEGLGVNATTVRSHLSRHNHATYERNDDGDWYYIGADEDEDEE